MNVSLMWNSVGFYQIVKLSMIPVSYLFEVAFDKIRYSRDTKLSILVVLLGVEVRTVTDVNAKGFAAAFIVVLSSALQQYCVHYFQRKYSLSSFNLLGHTAPIQYVIKKKYGQDAANVGDEGGFAPITFRKIKKILSF